MQLQGLRFLFLLPSTTMLILLILFSFLTQATATGLIEPIYFTFPSFDPGSCGPGGDLICSGTATISNGYVDLTPDPHASNSNRSSAFGKSAGRILYKQPMPAWPASFVTTFVARICKGPNSTDYGDGLAFIMAADGGPSPANSEGGFLGLYNQSTQGNRSHQLAVELDTYMNELDPNDNHIGIDTKSIMSDATFDLYGIGIDLKLGREVKVNVEYDAWKKSLKIFVAYNDDPMVSVLNHSISMKMTVPPVVYVGFTASTWKSSIETHQIISWAFTALPVPSYKLGGESKAGEQNAVLIIAIPTVTGVLGLALCLFLFIRKLKWPKKERKREREKKNEDIESRSRSAANVPKTFTYQQISKATLNFSEHNLLGKGGFGSVYRGDLSDSPFTIAVKRISATAAQGEREYFAEICTIGRLRHKNLVKLHGWCHERDNLLLVYEFMPSGSLDRFISKGFLDWPTRYKVLTGLASALLYLHEECGNTVIHRDVKPNNVMLDADYNARLGDFGLARLLMDETAVTTMLAGTPGYLAPECTYTGKATTETDVFSFGIVVLEVLCGRRTIGGIGGTNLVDYMWDLNEKCDLLQGVDKRLEGQFDEEEMKRALVVGLLCSHPDPRLRPTMRKVVHIFTNPNEPLMELPESRPSAIYVPVLSPTSSAAALGSSATTTSTVSQTALNDTSVLCAR